MKKTRVLLCLGLVGLLSSCGIYDLINGDGLIPSGGGSITIKTDTLQKKTLSVYDLKKYTVEAPSSKDLSPYKVTDLDVYYPQGSEDVLYIPFADYCAHLARYFKPDYSGSVSGNAAQQVWDVKHGSSLVYQARLNLAYATFSVGGGLYGADVFTPNYNRSSLVITRKNTQDTIAQGETYVTHSFADFKTPIYKNDNTYYFPLALLEAELGKEYGSWHFHDFNRLYRYDDRSQLSAEFTLNGKTLNAEQGVKDYIATNLTMPEGMRRLDADTIYYVFQNQYGLLAQRGYSSGKAALDSAKVYDRLLSSNTLTRQTALYESFAVFDDDHTGVYPSHGEMWGETSEGYVRGPHSIARSKTTKSLKEKRAAWLEEQGKSTTDVLYHQDMAYFSFDSFSYAKEAYVGDTTTLREDLYTEDSFYYFLHQFNAIDAHEGIKDIIIDVSLNGGGVVAIMQKLCALISPNNSSRMGMYVISSGTKYDTITEVDVNGDGKFNFNETYGGKYNFYILTSDASFSCGNAFPFLARKQGFAKIIGTNSGGGECTVDSSFLPSGHGIVFSSMNHIGFYNKGSSVFYGDEGGAGVEIALSEDSFYDLPSLYQAIHK